MIYSLFEYLNMFKARATKRLWYHLGSKTSRKFNFYFSSDSLLVYPLLIHLHTNPKIYFPIQSSPNASLGLSEKSAKVKSTSNKLFWSNPIQLHFFFFFFLANPVGCLRLLPRKCNTWIIPMCPEQDKCCTSLKSHQQCLFTEVV